jgi:RHS repeat-associated protein
LARLSGTTMSSPSGATIANTDTYDNASRLTNISYTNGGSTLASYTYGYNAASQITSYQGLSNSLSYTYLQDGELSGASGTLAGSTYSATYNYDANGNRTSTSTNIGGTITNATYTTATGNELTGDGTNTYTFDNNGNTLTQTNTSTGTVTHFTWDYENRLTEVKVVSSGGTVLNDEKFTYDVLGNRIGVSLNGTQTLYTVYDGSNPYMDFNGSGQLTERYLYNPDALNQFYGQVNASGTTEWFLTDNLNSIRQVLNANGATLSTIVYDPYGQLLTSLNTSDPRFLYTGGAYDAITGMYTDGAREENPVDGRWMSQDPLGLLSGENLYRYTTNAPTNETDPNGLCGRRGGLFRRRAYPVQYPSNGCYPTMNYDPAFAASQLPTSNGASDAGSSEESEPPSGQPVTVTTFHPVVLLIGVGAAHATINGAIAHGTVGVAHRWTLIGWLKRIHRIMPQTPSNIELPPRLKLGESILIRDENAKPKGMLPANAVQVVVVKTIYVDPLNPPANPLQVPSPDFSRPQPPDFSRPQPDLPPGQLGPPEPVPEGRRGRWRR